jgi:hypothetical protein
MQAMPLQYLVAQALQQVHGSAQCVYAPGIMMIAAYCR